MGSSLKFRKRPIIIEAFKCSDVLASAKTDWENVPESIRDAYEKGGWVFAETGVYIPTFEGTMLAEPSDWIIRGVKGEFYPCKPDIFEMTYESEYSPMLNADEDPGMTEYNKLLDQVEEFMDGLVNSSVSRK